MVSVTIQVTFTVRFRLRNMQSSDTHAHPAVPRGSAFAGCFDSRPAPLACAAPTTCRRASQTRAPMAES